MKIINCTCTHAYQDSKLGAYRRWANAWKNGWRCTVCSREYVDKS